MTKGIKEAPGDRAARGEATPRVLRPVLLRYTIVRQGDKSLQLLHVPLGFSEEALVMFSSREKAQEYYLSRRRFLSEAFDEEWYAQAYSQGELISLLCGICKDTEWVLLDPKPGARFVVSDTQEAGFMSRERFVDQLFE